MIDLSYFIKRRREELVMIKNNLWRIIWIVGIYAVLISILCLVVSYKVKWEDRDLNTYLYFYKCSSELCTTTTKQEKYYTNVICDHNICPYIVNVNNNIVILKKEEKTWLYDYIKGITINDEYEDYRETNDGLYIVKDKNNLEGIINAEGEIIVEPTYQKISEYKDGYVAYYQEGKINIDKVIEKDNVVSAIESDYDKVVLINSRFYAYADNDGYHFMSYDPTENNNHNVYDYMYAIDKYVLVVKNGQIDILDGNLQTKLLMKIDSYYTYKVGEERDSLDIYIRDGLIHFSVYIKDTDGEKTNNYIYDTRNNKLYS